MSGTELTHALYLAFGLYLLGHLLSPLATWAGERLAAMVKWFIEGS